VIITNHHHKSSSYITIMSHPPTKPGFNGNRPQSNLVGL
jgi:hypothetical protein